MQTSGNTILITGGTSGIGLAFARQFIEDGNTVIICGRRASRLVTIKEELPGIITMACDIADAAQREQLCGWATLHYPHLNVLVNNAGVQYAADLTKPINLENVRIETETNFIAPLHLASLFAPHLTAQKDAAIINISSGLAFAPLAFMPVYCATKAAVHSLTLSLRYQLKDTTVKVVEIAPPSTDTELGHQRRAGKTQSHGGIPISEFLAEAIEGLKKGEPEIVVGLSKGMRAKPDEMFNMMNR